MEWLPKRSWLLQSTRIVSDLGPSVERENKYGERDRFGSKHITDALDSIWKKNGESLQFINRKYI